MSVFNKLNDKSLLLLLNQIREDFLEEGEDPSQFSDFFENGYIVHKKCSYFGIDNIDRTDMTYLLALFMELSEEIYEGEITELPARPTLGKYNVEWREVSVETNEYIYETKIDSYCDLEIYDMEVLRSEDYFEPWGGKMTEKNNLDYETTDDECNSVKKIFK